MIVTFHKYGYILPRTGAVVHWWWEDTPGGLLCRKEGAVDLYMVSYPGDGDAFPHVYFCGEMYSAWDRQKLEASVKKRAAGVQWGHLVDANGPVDIDTLIEEYLDNIFRAKKVLEYMDPEIRRDLIFAHGYNHPAAIIMSYLGKYGNLEVDNV